LQFRGVSSSGPRQTKLIAFLSVNLNPTFQKTISLKSLKRGEVNRATGLRFDITGKGINTTRVLCQLGARVVHLTHLGHGRNLLLGMCEKEGLDIVWADSESPIRTCITLLDDETGSSTEIVEPTREVEESTVAEIRGLFSRELERADWIILSGSKAPGYPSELFAEFCFLAEKEGAKTVVDYRGNELLASLEARITVVKINLVEFVDTFLPKLPASEKADSDALDAVEEEICRLSSNGPSYVITRGGRDVLYASNGLLGRVTPPPIRVLNTIGSGDAFCAGLTYSLARGFTLEESVREGARCGSLNAGLLRPGTLKAAPS